MYSIDNKYFEDEVIDGFYVPSISKRAWAAELSVLHELDRICNKYGIRYFADWGTLLGAVRHGGFVPWDDDLDVCMFRSDLDRFVAAAKTELPEGYHLYSFENSDNCWKFVLNLVNTDRMNFSPEYLKSHYNFPYIATVDIFVFDNVTDDEEYEERRREAVKYILQVFDALKEDNVNSDGVKKLLLYIKNTHGIDIINNGDYTELKRNMYRAVLRILTEKNDEETVNVCQMISWGIYYKHSFPRSLYDNAVKLPFEDMEIPVPSEYETVLAFKYGDYDTPRIGACAHGYPYFNAQKEALGLPKDADYIPHYRWDGGVFRAEGLEKRNARIAAVDEYKKTSDYQGEYDRRTVIFLPLKGEYWDRMKPFYEAECARSNTDVYVIPIPYFYKEYDGSFTGDAQYDLDAYPEDLPGYLYEEVDIEALFADRIYIQNPYDEYNMCMSVPKEYYASSLLENCRELIYVPWFETADFTAENYPSNYNMQYYCTVPGVVLSDEVYVSSEVIRDRYVEKLTAFAGEESRGIWEKKIKIHV